MRARVCVIAQASAKVGEDQTLMDLCRNTDAMRAHLAQTATWIEDVTVQTFRKIRP